MPWLSYHQVINKQQIGNEGQAGPCSILGMTFNNLCGNTWLCFLETTYDLINI